MTTALRTLYRRRSSVGAFLLLCVLMSSLLLQMHHSIYRRHALTKIKSPAQLQSAQRLRTQIAEVVSFANSAINNISNNLYSRLGNSNTTNTSHLLQPFQKVANDTTVAAPPPFVGASNCKAVRRYFLLKTHKCASTTIQNIAFRYALQHELVAMIPAPGNFFTSIGWPDPPQPYHFIPHPKNKNFDVLVNHIVYRKQFVDMYLGEDAARIGILRKPFDHFLSFYAFFNIEKEMHLPAKVFLEDPYKHGKVHIKFVQNKDIKLRNFLSRQFGAVDSDLKTNESIQKFVSRVDKDFHLVMISEYLDESLVLLMRHMCWDFLDITHKSLNKRVLKHGVASQKNASKEVVQRFGDWSAADYVMYRHFNRTLWSKIERMPGFMDDLTTFKTVQEAVLKFCSQSAVNVLKLNYTFASSNETVNRLVTRQKYCVSLDKMDIQYNVEFAAKQYPGKTMAHFGKPCCQT